MKKQTGFTLIELVMVIVILGILAAFALPRFADLGQEARAASIQGAAGAIKSAAAIAHAQCVVDNACNAGIAASTTNLEGTAIAMRFGYPAATAAGIQAATQIAATDYTVVTVGTALVFRAIGAATPASCQVSYTPPAAANNAPVIATTVTAC